MIRKLAHVCLVTDQLAALHDFYTRVIGLKQKFTFVNAEKQTFGYYFACGDTTFIEVFDRTLMQKQWGGDGKPLTRGNQMTHFCFEVTGLEQVRAELIERGAKFGPIHRGMDESMQSWTADPDGNPIEFMEYTHASWQLNDRP